MRENPIESQMPGKLYQLFADWVRNVYGTTSSINTDEWAQILDEVSTGM